MDWTVYCVQSKGTDVRGLDTECSRMDWTVYCVQSKGTDVRGLDTECSRMDWTVYCVFISVRILFSTKDIGAI